MQKTVLPSVCFHCSLEIKNKPIIYNKSPKEELYFCCLGCSIAYQTITATEDDKNQVLEKLVKKKLNNDSLNITNKTTNNDIFYIKGLTCVSCAPIVEKVLELQEGVSLVKVNPISEKIRLSYDKELFDFNKAQKELKKFGYTIQTLDNKDALEHHTNMYILRLAMVWFLSMNIMAFSLGQYYGQLDEKITIFPIIIYIEAFLSFIVIFVLGFGFIKSAVLKGLKGKLSMETLISFGTLTAYFYSLYQTIHGKYEVYYDTASMIVAFVILGKFLESASKSKASQTIKKLLSLWVQNATVLENGEEKIKEIEDVIEGNFIVVKAGEKIPVDGIIIEGSSYIDESVLTGESLPVLKNEGTKVYSATINQDGRFIFKATAIGNNTALAKIIDLVEKAQSEKTESQKLADKLSVYFIPIVFILALSTALYGYFMGFTPDVFLMRTIAVLVVACPCALGLAAPMATYVGLDKSASLGIILKNASLIEELNDIDVIITDKTGTLTEGKMKVSKINYFDETYDKEKLLQMIYSLENFSEHPIAKSISNHLKELGLKIMPVNNFVITKGLGVEGKIDDLNIKIGNKTFLNYEKNLNNSSDELITEIFVSVNESIIASIELEDTIKKGVKDTLDKFKTQNKEIIMLTGDNSIIAKKIAAKVGIERFYAEQLPADKLNFISELQKQGKKVMMIGDGINDAPSLVQADIGVAISNASDISMEASDITIIKNDFEVLPKLFEISELSLKYLKINMWWAFSYNFVSIPLAMFGLLKPISAAAAMAISSLLIVSNSLRLRRKID